MKILLVDGNSFCYRAFYAVRELRTSKGRPTNAVYGFITMIERLLKQVDPDGIALTFDVKGPTFRHKRYEDYKVQRAPMPEDLVEQMPVIKEVVRAFRIPIFEKEGYEADDVIATLASRLARKGHEVYAVTGDKDALQLVTEKVRVLNPQKDNAIYDRSSVREKWGVDPEQVPDLMALMGDTSDNIPGVHGIGDKTASKLINEYGSLEKLYKNIDKVGNERVRLMLIEHKDDAFLSKELATVDREVPLEMEVADIRRQEPDVAALAALYKELEFRSLLKALPVTQPSNADDDTLDYHLVEGMDAFEELVEKLGKHKRWALDFETTAPHPMQAVPIGISFSWKAKQAYYVPFEARTGDLFGAAGSAPTSGPRRPTPEEALKRLKPLLEDPKIAKVGQNIKYETVILRKYGIHLAGIAFDTMVASYCINPAKPNHNLDDIALEHLGVTITPITDLIGSGRGQISMADVEIGKLYRYGCQDSDVTLRLADVLAGKLEERGVAGLFEDIEMPLVPVLADMEYNGVAIDAKLLGKLSAEMDKTLQRLTGEIHAAAGQEFNINSPKQLGEILFDKLKLPVVKKTKTGASTDVEVLLELAEVHPLPKLILKFRELSKLKSTYVDALPELVDPATGRVHPSYNQTVTATGRLSCSDPNVQNIPVRTEEGRKIRRAFVASGASQTLISADYSQIELRVLAHLSGDKNLIRAFNEGADIHRFTASLIFGVDMDKVEPQMRDSAKTVNFGVLYGMGAFSLAKSLDITMEAARDFIKSYFERYPSVKGYLDGTIERCKKDGYVETYFKRRRYIPEIQSRDPRMKAFAERTAINAPIQGTASDIIKIAMDRIAPELAEHYKSARLILQVHDELVFEVSEKDAARLAKMVRERMSEAARFDVPLEVSVKTGPNWLDMEKLGRT